ncbi:hypothetical protein Tco_1167874 [Tanacetum coccineum]
MARKSKKNLGKVTLLFDSMLVQNQAPEGEGSTIPPEPQPTPSTSQPNVLEPQTESLQTKTPLTVSHELQTEGDKPRRQDTTLGGADAQTRPETASKISCDLPLLEVNTSGRRKDNMEYHDDLMDFVPPIPHDSPLLGGNTPGSDEGRMALIQELMETCTSLTKRVLALEEAKTAQDRVITKLKLRVKRL